MSKNNNILDEGTVLLPRLLTEAEVCEYLGIKLDTLRYWRRTGQIEFIKIQRQIRFRYDVIVNLLDESTRAATG